jgi:hypothetical protein
MSELQPIMRDQRAIDADHLNLLSIFHFVSAGLAILGILFVVAHYAMFSVFFANPKMWEATKAGPPPVAIFCMFKWFYVVFGLWFLMGGIGNVISGIGMRKRKWRAFSLVVAGYNCLHVPLGTILGVFTFIVLLRESVREVYEQNKMEAK